MPTHVSRRLLASRCRSRTSAVRTGRDFCLMPKLQRPWTCDCCVALHGPYGHHTDQLSHGVEVPNLIFGPAAPETPPAMEAAEAGSPMLLASPTPAATEMSPIQLLQAPVQVEPPIYRMDQDDSGNDGTSDWGTPAVSEQGSNFMVIPDLGEESRLAELSEEVVTAPTFHVETRLPNGKPALLLDIGSVGNLAGDAWVKQQAAVAMKAGKHPEQRRRETPLTVRGVGHGGQKCTHNCILPVALVDETGAPSVGTFETPTVPNSELPALLGLETIKKCRMLIDASRNQVYMIGPGDYDLMRHLPPGTQRFDCVTAPSGHMMLPCAEFANALRLDKHGGTLRLKQPIALPVNPAPSGSQMADSSGAGASSSSSSH